MAASAVPAGQTVRRQRPRSTQDNGPWLIVAASFSGNGAEKQAHDLAEELRERFRMAAYVHEMDFKFGDDTPGRGLDEYGADRVGIIGAADQVREIAVLVGDFASIDDPDAQQMLNRIKTLQPNALNVDAESDGAKHGPGPPARRRAHGKTRQVAQAAGRWLRRFSRAIRCCRGSTSCPRASIRLSPK